MTMEVIVTYSPSFFTKNLARLSTKPPKNPPQIPPSLITFPVRAIQKTNLSSSFPISCSSARTEASTSSSPLTSVPSTEIGSGNPQRHWMVLVEGPPKEFSSRQQIIGYYVKTLERVLGSEKIAQRSIYDASCPTNFGFCCDIDPEAAQELASLPGILSVMPDPDFDSVVKDYSRAKVHHLDGPSISLSDSDSDISLLFPIGTSKHWLVRVDKPPGGIISKAQVVDYYVQILTKVLGNEKDAQMCIYHISSQSSYGFCCELDDDCAQELAGVSGVLSVHLDPNFGLDDKDYGGEKLSNEATEIKTKKLFVTGLSFYTSEKTLRAAFEGFGELVEVKIIMDKISKRSKGYAFIEYTTEEAAETALREMNGKIINGWMITVDVARKNPPKFSRGRPT